MIPNRYGNDEPMGAFLSEGFVDDGAQQHPPRPHHSWPTSTSGVGRRHRPGSARGAGEIVVFKDIDVTCGQITRSSGVEVLTSLDLSRVNPIAGPVYVDGAEPGDSLKVTLLEVAVASWAWTCLANPRGCP